MIFKDQPNQNIQFNCLCNLKCCLRKFINLDNISATFEMSLCFNENVFFMWATTICAWITFWNIFCATNTGAHLTPVTNCIQFENIKFDTIVSAIWSRFAWFHKSRHFFDKMRDDYLRVGANITCAWIYKPKQIFSTNIFWEFVAGLPTHILRV